MIKFNGGNLTQRRTWTKEDLDLLESMLSKKENIKTIALSLNRSIISVKIKIKRLNKKNDSYNEKHRDDKYLYNQLFLEKIKPKSLLDVFAGNSCYKGYVKVTTNDINHNFNCDYNMNAFDLLCKLYLEKKKFDIVDLDPFGSAIHCLPLALLIAKKGLIITLGEVGHIRWKRLDFVSKWYNINSIEEFTSDKLINEIIIIGKRYKKTLTPIFKRDYKNISRVWFEISDYKETKQWHQNE